MYVHTFSLSLSASLTLLSSNTVSAYQTLLAVEPATRWEEKFLVTYKSSHTQTKYSPTIPHCCLTYTASLPESHNNSLYDQFFQLSLLPSIQYFLTSGQMWRLWLYLKTQTVRIMLFSLQKQQHIWSCDTLVYIYKPIIFTFCIYIRPGESKWGKDRGEGERERQTKQNQMSQHYVDGHLHAHATVSFREYILYSRYNERRLCRGTLTKGWWKGL